MHCAPWVFREGWGWEQPNVFHCSTRCLFLSIATSNPLLWSGWDGGAQLRAWQGWHQVWSRTFISSGMEISFQVTKSLAFPLAQSALGTGVCREGTGKWPLRACWGSGGIYTSQSICMYNPECKCMKVNAGLLMCTQLVYAGKCGVYGETQVH